MWTISVHGFYSEVRPVIDSTQTIWVFSYWITYQFFSSVYWENAWPSLQSCAFTLPSVTSKIFNSGVIAKCYVRTSGIHTRFYHSVHFPPFLLYDALHSELQKSSLEPLPVWTYIIVVQSRSHSARTLYEINSNMLFQSINLHVKVHSNWN